MTQEELRIKLKSIPDTFVVNNDVEWYTKPLKMQTWWKKANAENILEALPIDCIEDEKLALKYDNAYANNMGLTPSKENYKQLLDECETIEVKGDKGLLLTKDGRYIYFAEGQYWTSSVCRDEEGTAIPLHLDVSNGEYHFSSSYKATKQLFIMPIKIKKK